MDLDVGALSRHLPPSPPTLAVAAVVSLSGCFSPKTTDDTNSDSAGTADVRVSESGATVANTTFADTNSADSVTTDSASGLSEYTSTASDSGDSPICGNNVTEAPEECDDGNLIDQDLCRANCTDARCGDGVTAIGWEICDDGNTDNTDECTEDCHLPRCGDGYVYAVDEDCDDGNREDGDECPSSCVFGDGTTGTSEANDDGATDSSGMMDSSTGEEDPLPSHLCPVIDFFGEPEVLATSAVDHLLVSGDGLSSIFSTYNEDSDTRTFYRESRSSSRGGFAGPTHEDASFSRLDDTGAEGWGFIHITSMTTDGLTAYTLTGGGGFFRIYAATRETPTQEFMAPEPIDLGRDGRFPYARVSGDGQRLYIAGGSADDGLFVSHAAASGFETMDQIVDALVYRFAVSPNELFVVYSEYPSLEENFLWIAQRNSLDEEFGRPVALEEFSSEVGDGSPLWISDDGCEIFLSATNDILAAYKE